MFCKKSCLLVVMFITTLCGKAQMCGTDILHENLLKTDTAYAAHIAKQNELWAAYAANKNRASSKKIVVAPNDTIYEIPVVVHVLHRGEAIGTQHNPTDAEIVDWIDYTNKTFAATWPFYPDTNNGGARVPIKLTLAKRDPNCSPTNGIDRVDARSISKYEKYGIDYPGGTVNLGTNYWDVANAVAWNQDEYYNIFIVHQIEDTTGIAGFAFYPGAPYDGAFIETRVVEVGIPVLAHELGHAFGLRHTFEGDNNGASCPTNANCNTDGDMVCDTEPHKRSFVACANETNPCTNAPFSYTGANFMSYSRNCVERFTLGQKDRVLFSARNERTRRQLVESDMVLQLAVKKYKCVSDFRNFDTSVQYSFGFLQFEFKNIFDFSPLHTKANKLLYQDFSCRKTTMLETGHAYEFVLYSNLTSPPPQNITIYIDYNNDGEFQPSTELVATTKLINSKCVDTIRIPTTGVVLCKYLRMRVVSETDVMPPAGPCTNLVNGQIKDYGVYIRPDQNLGISIAHAPSAIPTCPGEKINFTATLNNANANNKILWYSHNNLYVGNTSFTYTAYANNDKVSAVLVSKNPVCDVWDTAYSNTVIMPHKKTNARPSISKNKDTIVSDIYPVDWHLDGTGVVASNSYTGYIPASTGIYYAYNVAHDGCLSIRSNNMFSFPLEVQEPLVSQTQIYPNPTKSYFDVRTKSNDIFVEKVSISNIVGQVIASYNNVGKSIRVNTSNWDAGVYMVLIVYKNGLKETIKIVIED